MTTTNTTIFTITRDDAIDSALGLCGVFDAGVTIPAADYTYCGKSLNVMLKNWATKGYVLNLYQNISIALTATTSSYTIAPSGGTVTANRPLRIAQGWVRDTSTPALDIPMIQLSRNGYNLLTPKTIAAPYPTNFYYDPQTGTSAVATGTLYIWPVTSASSLYTAWFSCERQIQDMTNSTDNFDMPQEWYLPIIWGLAEQIALRYTVNLQKFQVIQLMAAKYLEEMSNFSREEAPVVFSPTSQGASGAV